MVGGEESRSGVAFRSRCLRVESAQGYLGETDMLSRDKAQECGSTLGNK